MAKTLSMDPVQIVELLRARIFALIPQELELDSASPAPWGLVTEIGYPGEVVTLVVLADGSVSVYLRSGGGRIGCGLHPDLRAAAMRTLQIARKIEPTGAAEVDRSMPADGKVRFHFLEAAPARSFEASRAQLDDGAIDLAELYYAAHAVIGAIELTGTGQPIVEAIENAAASMESEIAANPPAPKGRGKLCRILPYAGIAVRRSRH